MSPGATEKEILYTRTDLGAQWVLALPCINGYPAIVDYNKAFLMSSHFTIQALFNMLSML